MYAYFNRFTIQVTKAQAEQGAHQGQCYDDVKSLLELPKVKRQFKHIPADDIKAELSEYGAWDENELSNDDENRIRILWLACGDILDELHEARRTRAI